MPVADQILVQLWGCIKCRICASVSIEYSIVTGRNAILQSSIKKTRSLQWSFKHEKEVLMMKYQTFSEQIVFRSCRTTCLSSIFLRPFRMAWTDTWCCAWTLFCWLGASSRHRHSKCWLLRYSIQTLLIFEVASCINLIGSNPIQERPSTQIVARKMTEFLDMIPLSSVIAPSSSSLHTNCRTSHKTLLAKWAKSLEGQFL